jgi:predicted GIY-YIG superfamily endonuclease
LYIILLGGFGSDENEFALYIGETIHKPEKRLTQHLNGVHASRVVKKRGICLLPSLYAHLNPLQRADAKELELRLKEIFIAVGTPERLVKGGH